jgi:hypothetical protein
MDNKNSLRWIRFSILGIFVIILATTTINLSNILGTGLLIVTTLSYWVAIVQAGLLCLVTYAAYKWVLSKMIRRSHAGVPVLKVDRIISVRL